MSDLLARQRRYMDEEWTPPPWIERAALTPMADYAWHSSLIACRNRLPRDLTDASILIVNCGSGVDTHFFQTEGAGCVGATDISLRALAAMRSHCPGATPVVADTERLPFPDGAFDWVGVRSGLHHLERPYAGLAEMARVARAGFFFIEAQDTVLVPVLVRLGFLEAEEEAGNRVFRFRRRDVAAQLEALEVDAYTIRTAWFMQVPPLLELSKRIPGRAAAWLLRAFVWTLNLFIGRVGNCMVVVARLRGTQTRRALTDRAAEEEDRCRS
ncbi:MAG: class I SAM-dependent methyltransferase [Candidatus Hydrogenedentes bacterium]|nr:class I SAM-dependent methyltransferase [Candidatus Hydrogenedentota bacterium]